VKTFGVYKITNTKTGEFYVGSTAIAFSTRWSQWKANFYHGRLNERLLADLGRFNASDFSFSIIECVSDESRVLEREQYWIDKLRPYYNICPKAGSRLGSKMSEATRRKMLGRKASKNTRAKMSASQKGRPRPPMSKQHCLNISKANKGRRVWNKGLSGIYSKATLKKISDAGKGRPCSALTRLKRSKAMKAVKRTKQWCRRISKALNGRPVPTDTRLRIAESVRRRHRENPWPRRKGQFIKWPK
jgi:group I intron endonuclease